MEMEVQAILNNEVQHGNYQKAQAFGERFFHAMNEELMIPCSGVFLRLEGEDVFRLVFLVPPEKYRSSDFAKAYKHSRDERRKINNDSFYVIVMFFRNTETLDKSKMVRDGFYYYYDGKAE